MIKIKQLLTELELKSGDYVGFGRESADMVYDIVQRNSSDNNLQNKLHTIFINEKLTAAKKLSALTSVLKGSVVGKMGTFVLITTAEGSDVNYSCWNFDPMIWEDGYEFCVGFISTQILKTKNVEYGFANAFELKNVLQIHDSSVADKYKGKGIGKFMYDSVMKTCDALLSDRILYQGSFGMWTGHVKKDAKLFGMRLNCSGRTMIIPISSNVSLDRKSITILNNREESNLVGFIGIYNNVPPTLLKLQSFVAGINPVDIAIWTNNNPSLSSSADDIYDIIEDATSLQDIIDDITPTYSFERIKLPANTKILILMIGDATLCIKKSGSKFIDMIL